MFTATWLTIEVLDKWLKGKWGLLLELDSVHQAPVDDQLSELMQVLGTYSQKIKSSTIEINGQVAIANRNRDFLQYIKNFTVRLGPCFPAQKMFHHSRT